MEFRAPRGAEPWDLRELFDGDLFDVFLLFELGDDDLEHAVFDGGLDVLHIGICRKHKAALKASKEALDTLVPFVAFFFFELALAADDQDVVLELDVDILFFDPGQVDLEDIGVLILA